MVKNGMITKHPCYICGDIEAEAHHIQYDDPENVVWLCHKHHMNLHSQLRTQKDDLHKSDTEKAYASYTSYAG
jgi:hypothetical protein